MSASAQRGKFVFLPEDDSRKERRRAKGRRFRRTRKLIAVFLVSMAFLLTGGVAASAQPSTAQAWFPNPTDVIVDSLEGLVCGYSQEWSAPPAIEPWPGLGGMVSLVAGPNGLSPGSKAIANTNFFTSDTNYSAFTPYNGKAVTAYEWYGMAGLKWHTSNYKDIDGMCVMGLLREAAGFSTSLWWGFTLLIGGIGLTLFEYASSIDTFTPFLGTMTSIIEKLQTNLYLEFLMPVVMLGALWMGWQGLVKRRGMEATQGALWMIGATAAGFMFFANPTWIAKGTNDIVTTVQTTIISSLSSVGVSNFPENDPCWVPEGGGINGAQRQASRIAQCSMWYTFLFVPWASGQFGAANGTVWVKGFYDEEGNLIPFDNALTIGKEFPLDGQSGVGGDPGNYKRLADLNGYTNPDGGIAIAWLQLNALSYNHDQVLEGLAIGALPSPGNPTPPAGFAEKYAEVQSAKSVQWQAILERFARSPGAVGAQKPLIYYEPEQNPEWTTPPGTAQWSGADPTHRFLVATVALVAMFTGAVPVMFISFVLVLQQLGFVFLMLFSPVFLLLGVHPGFGRKIAMGWIEQIIGLSLKRIGNALVLGVMMAMYTSIMTAVDGIWFLQIMLISIVAFATLLFRKRIVDGMSQVRFGGSGADYSGEAAGATKRAAQKGLSQTADVAVKAAGGGVGSAITAGIGGALIGASGGLLAGSKFSPNKKSSGKVGGKDGGGNETKPNPFDEFQANTIVGRVEREEHARREEEKLRQRERRAMDRAPRTEETAEEWLQYALQHGKHDKDGQWVPRPIPRPEGDPQFEQMLLAKGLKFQEPLQIDAKVKITDAEMYDNGGGSSGGTGRGPDKPDGSGGSGGSRSGRPLSEADSKSLADRIRDAGSSNAPNATGTLNTDEPPRPTPGPSSSESGGGTPRPPDPPKPTRPQQAGGS